jgi:two-component system, cell cycle response regulator DivK
MKQTILVIEDDIQSLYLFTFLLESENYKVIQSTDGIHGIAKAKHYKPDAIILDIQLPEINGYEIAKMIKGNDELKNIPIIGSMTFGVGN